MRELSLFTGAGGGLLGTTLLGWTHVGYVEIDDYCQRVIAARIADGILDNAPIFSDIRAFISDGYADAYQGLVDVVSGGFPCQPFSVAGKRAGADDHRNMWPATIECIRRVQPAYAFLENVPGLLNSGYFGTILGDLAESGYDTRWRVLSAAEVGAPHRRDRLWIVATNSDHTERRRNGQERQAHQRDTESTRNGESWHVAHAQSKWEPQFEGGANRREGERGETERFEPGAGGGSPYGDTAAGTESRRRTAAEVSQTMAHADSAGRREQRRAESGDECLVASELSGWWEVEPDVGRVVDGLAYRNDRLRALGNGQVPLVAATAWRLLNE